MATTQFDRETLIEKALKIKAMADRGETHEADAAKNALQSFLDKHNLSYEDVFDEVIIDDTYRYHSMLERQLMVQVFYNLFGNKGRAIKAYANKKNAPKVLVVCLTKAEHVDFQTHWYHYRDEMNKELSVVQNAFLDAFVHKTIFIQIERIRENPKNLYNVHQKNRQNINVRCI